MWVKVWMVGIGVGVGCVRLGCLYGCGCGSAGDSYSAFDQNGLENR